MAASSSLPIANIMVSFANDDPERIIASDLGRALKEKVTTMDELRTGAALIPPSQTRISFYGHGSPEIFGSNTEFYNAPQFAELVNTILKKNPGIKDIDLFSCNHGLIDDKGMCYVSKVQAYLQSQGYHVNVNTFLVPDEKQDVVESFFVVGSCNLFNAMPRQQLKAKGIDLVEADEFSVDVLRRSNESFMRISQAMDVLNREKAEQSAIEGLLGAMKTCLNKSTYTEAALRAEMSKTLPASSINYAFSRHPVECNTEQGYFKCLTLLTDAQRGDYHDKHANVKAGIFQYTGDVRAVENILDRTKEFIERESQLNILSTQARASSGRLYKAKLVNIRDYVSHVDTPQLAVSVEPRAEASAPRSSTAILNRAMNGIPAASAPVPEPSQPKMPAASPAPPQASPKPKEKEKFTEEIEMTSYRRR